MSRKLCNAATATDEEHRVCQVVQILKNDMVDDQSSDERDNKDENLTRSRTKVKKSLFAALIKRKTKKPKMKITCSTIKFGTESLSSDQELATYQYSTETTHIPLNKPKKEKHYNFFQKIMKGSKSDETMSKKNRELVSSNICLEATNTGRKVLSKALTLSSFVPTTYIPRHNTKLINGINELQDILHILHDNEQHVVYLLKRYIGDKTVQKQLIEASFEYFSLQYESKCQTNILADKLWARQLDATKAQDYNLQKRLDLLVKTNRALELQSETLCRQCEKLAARGNLYPKRFLHMRSFGKIYARQLIDNNRKLQHKLKSLACVISNFEEELQKLQQQKSVLEEEKKHLKTQVYHLEGTLEKNTNDSNLEKAELTVQLDYHNHLITEAVNAVQLIFQDLHDFDRQVKEIAIVVTWPNFQCRDACLPDMIYQVRACVGEFFMSMVAAYRSLTLVTKDINKLRNTNARLQENLQKSTNELDNLSKKLEKSGEGMEARCSKLEQENYGLKLKLETVTEHNYFLREEMEVKKTSLNDTKASVNEVLSQNQSLASQIDEVVQTVSQLGTKEISREFTSTHDKLEYLKLRHNQVAADRKHLAERCDSLEEENRNLVQAQQCYQQDVATLQDGLTILSAENDNLKRQLATEHSTVTTLQNERLKYLEEKNILKTIFQHLKGEVTRVQQLEGAVADMNKETSRLSLIAEFNKQLGEQLKNEVEMKENTIVELRQSLEKLSHLQVDKDKEKMNLCAQLSEVSSIKDKLSDCLEMELRKNEHLDESRKKLETSTKSQLKIYEEMQKNERAALRELLRDFKNLIKQRDCLVHMQEDNKKKYKELEKHCTELNKRYEEAVSQVDKRDEEIRKIIDKLQEQAERCRQLEESQNGESSKYEKNMRKIEKLLAQMRNEKKELETSNTQLRNNTQKLQNDLGEARGKAFMAENKLSAKTAECATLETELNTYRSEVQQLNQENGKIVLEMEYLKKMHEQQIAELKNTISNYSLKDNIYIESQTAVLTKEQQISELNKIIVEKENQIQRIEHECVLLRKQTEDQNKVMIGYENELVLLQDAEASKLRLEKELSKVQLEHQSMLLELESSKKETDNLKTEINALNVKNENEKSFYKNRTNEIIFEYSEQKANIEEEIENISNQLRAVTKNLHTEKHRFEELAKAHEDLQKRYHQLKDKHNAEVTAHEETNRRIEEMKKAVNAITSERDNLQQQVQVVLLEMNETKDLNRQLAIDNKRLQLILEQGRQQYDKLLRKNASLDEELRELRHEIETIIDSKETSQCEIEKTIMKLEEKNAELRLAKETIEGLKKELKDNEKQLFDQREDLFKLQQHVTGLEFKNCELTLRLHESQAKLETERNLYNELNVVTPRGAPSEGEELF